MERVEVAHSMADQRAASFGVLQRKLRPLWAAISRFSAAEQTIIVVPSLSVDPELHRDLLERIGPAVVVYEERLLFLLLLLRQPRARLVFVSSVPIEERIVDYYLSLMPGVIPEHARKRLFLISADDPSLTPLTAKLLARPDLLREVRQLITDPDRAHLVPYITTELETELALTLGVPIYGCDPRLGRFGTKSGARRLFEEEGVPHPVGDRDVRTVADLVDAVVRLRSQAPETKTFVVKHDEGGSGWGNAIIDASRLPPPAAPDERQAISQQVLSLSPVADGTGVADYLAKLEAVGGVVEELITAPEIRSPSVQLRITPLGEVELLSTHDQLLGGPSGQIFLGCTFPADPGYAAAITHSAQIIGRRLANEGVLGRFAVDFVVARAENSWRHHAVEINLRKGGTTHPYLTLQFLTDGRYHPERASFITSGGRSRCLAATDHLPLNRDLSLDELFDLAVVNGVHFDNSRQIGVVFHMLGGLAPFRLLGMTAVEETREGALALFDRTACLVAGAGL